MRKITYKSFCQMFRKHNDVFLLGHMLWDLECEGVIIWTDREGQNLEFTRYGPGTEYRYLSLAEGEIRYWRMTIARFYVVRSENDIVDRLPLQPLLGAEGDVTMIGG